MKQDKKLIGERLSSKEYYFDDLFVCPHCLNDMELRWGYKIGQAKDGSDVIVCPYALDTIEEHEFPKTYMMKLGVEHV